MSDRLRNAVDWWNKQTVKNATGTPFVDKDPYYVIPDYVQADRLGKSERGEFAKAKDEQNTADRYTLVEVVLASSPFLLGIAGVTRRSSIKLGTAGAGTAILLAAILILFTYAPNG